MLALGARSPKLSGNIQYINDLYFDRYSVTYRCNDVTVQVITSNFVASSNLEPREVNLTYDQLDELLQAHLGLSGSDPQPNPSKVQQLRNFRSTLNGFLASAGKTTASRIGVEFKSRFEESVNHYLKLLEVADSTKRDRRSHLKRYRELFSAHLEAAQQPRKKVTSLSEALREAIARLGVAPKTFARQNDISPSSIQRYLAGARPNQRGIPELRRIERALGFERDSLTKLVEEPKDSVPASQPNASYLMRQSMRSADPYFLRACDIGSSLANEWRQLFNYKTATVSAELERSSRGVWRCIPSSTSSIDSPFAVLGDKVCPSAHNAFERLRAYLGYLCRPVESGGEGIETASVQTLAWLADPSAINGYLEFLTQRSDGLVHQGQKGFAQFVSSLVRAKTGYLRQRPELGNRLPPNRRPVSAADWDQRCEQAYKIAQQWRRRATDMSRNPDAPILPLLGRDAPLQPVIETIARIEELALKSPPGTRSQARHKRDALLFALVISNPLRQRSLQSLTWSKDGTGSIYRTQGGWRLRLARSMIKNGERKAGEKYDVAIASWVGEMIEEYVDEYRDTLLNGKSSAYFFVAHPRGGLWKGMSGHVRKLTKRHIPETGGFALHAFRHLVASDLLKRNPNAFVSAAVLLNDTLATVMHSYAHLQRDDSFAVHHQYLGSLRGSDRRA